MLPPAALALSLSSVNVPSVESTYGVVNCTFIATIGEDHFEQQQHFRYGTCALDGDVSYAFGPNAIYLVNIFGDQYERGEQLQVRLRKATNDDEKHKRHRRLAQHPDPHTPMWAQSHRAFVVDQLLSSSPVPRVTQGRRRLVAAGPDRTLMTICMQYPSTTYQTTVVAASGTCSASLDAFTVGVHGPHEEASYNRLDSPWNQADSRFFTVQMDELNASRYYYSTLSGGYLESTFGVATMSCDDFKALEVPDALALAKATYPDANLDYSHVEYLTPSNIKCTWGGLGEVGSYNPNGVAGTTIPVNHVTWVKMPGGIGVRAHELGHNFGLMHSSSYSAVSNKYSATGWSTGAVSHSGGDGNCV